MYFTISKTQAQPTTVVLCIYMQSLALPCAVLLCTGTISFYVAVMLVLQGIHALLRFGMALLCRP